ncbi:hypothetical protein BR93DRAFT_972563 [Coniochaeta sp. PMI_546]|nr:hypothetical protein BR93DRAFT_972563 [Coniochaeta sp. PMI_546]
MLAMRPNLTTLKLTILVLVMASRVQAEDPTPADGGRFILKIHDYVWIGVAAGIATSLLAVVAYTGIKHCIAKKRKQKTQGDIELATFDNGGTTRDSSASM